MRAAALSMFIVAVPLVVAANGRFELLSKENLANRGSHADPNSISAIHPVSLTAANSIFEAYPGPVFQDESNANLLLLQTNTQLLMNTLPDPSNSAPSVDLASLPPEALRSLLQATMAEVQHQQVHSQQIVQQIAQRVEGLRPTGEGGAVAPRPEMLTSGRLSQMSLLQDATETGVGAPRPQTLATGQSTQLARLQGNEGSLASGSAAAGGHQLLQPTQMLVTAVFGNASLQSGACEAWRGWDEIFSPRGRGTFRFMKTLVCSRSHRGLSLLSMQNSTSDSTNASSSIIGSVGFWFTCLSVMMLVLGGITYYLCSRVPVLTIFPENDNFKAVRGGPRILPCCIVTTILFAWAVFGIAVLTIAVLNSEIAEHPDTTETIDNEVKTVHRTEIKSPGQRSFIAASTVPLSMMVATLTLTGWRRAGSVPIRAALMAQFVARGATLAVVAALLLEMAGGIITSHAKMSQFIGTLVVMSITGFAEEGSKVFAVISGLCLSEQSAEVSQQERLRVSSVVLVESEHAMMLAGLAVGYGFMTAENAGYLLDASTTPPMSYTDDDGTTQEVPGSSVTAIAGCIMFVRIFLNIHPWLAGVSASRIARTAFRDGHGIVGLTTWELLKCFLPSAAVHAFFDFIISVAPAVAIFAVPGIWFGVRWWFRHEWNSREGGAGAQPQARQLNTGRQGGAMQEASALVDRAERRPAKNPLRCC